MAEINRGFRSPESISATARDFSDLMDKLSLPESYLEHKGLILDVGSGWANFVKVANQKYGKTGTRVIGMDPAYAFLSQDPEETKQNLGRTNISISLDQGVLHGLRIDEYLSREAELLAEFYKEFSQSGDYIAGSHQDLPFKPESLDLVLSSNSLTCNNPEAVKRALLNMAESIKLGGEFRIAPFYKPFYIRFMENGIDLAVQDWRDDDPKRQEIINKLFKGDKEIESQIQIYNFLDFMRGLEQDLGMNFYSVEIFKDEARDPANTSLYSLIGVKGNQLPNIKKDKGSVCCLRKLLFHTAPDLSKRLTDEVLLNHQIMGKLESKIIKA
jgi:SAM-dependent methyltransferase